MVTLFDTYRFDNLQTDESRFIDRRSYLLAGLFGPFYVLYRGFVGLAVVMLVASTVLAAVFATCVVAAVSLFADDLLISVGAAIALPVAFLVAQALVAVQLLRFGYIRRGWREGY